MKLPDFFIVGAPKSGTTAMYTYLKEHPDIFMPQVKEPSFFNTDFYSPSFIRSKEKYISLFAEVQHESRIGEASPWYLYSKKAAAGIKEMCDCASIIIMLRNPVDMIYSLHSHYLYNGSEDIKDFQLALEAEAERKNGLNYPNSVIKKTTFIEKFFYREVGKYSEQIERYMGCFSKNNIYIIIFDEFKENPAKAYKELLQYLKLEDNFQPNFEVVNANKNVKSKRIQNILNYPPDTARLIGRSLIPSQVRHTLYKSIKAFNTRYQPRIQMDSELKRSLKAEFAPEVEKLSKLLNRDLSHWCKK